MAAAMGCGSRTASFVQLRNSSSRRRSEDQSNKARRVSCEFSRAPVSEPYKTLRIRPDASESEIKKAFRRLALQYHPDVCRGNDCGIQFQLINEAYDVAMSNLRGESTSEDPKECDYEMDDEPMRGMHDQDWDLWEEWMGWEGAGIRDYSSHINPYI